MTTLEWMELVTLIDRLNTRHAGTVNLPELLKNVRAYIGKTQGELARLRTYCAALERELSAAAVIAHDAVELPQELAAALDMQPFTETEDKPWAMTIS